MSDEAREPTTSEQPAGPEEQDQQTRESPALGFSPPAGGPEEPSEPPAAPAGPFGPPAAPAGPFGPPAAPATPSGPAASPATSPAPAGPPATPPELWSSPAPQRASDLGASPDPELDKAPRVETVPGSEASSGGGGLDPDRVIAVARKLAEKPEVLLGAAFGGGILLAMIIRRLGS